MEDNKNRAAEEKRVRAIIIGALLLAATIAAFIGNVLILLSKEIELFHKFVAIIYMAACVCVVWYIVNGYRKTAAKWYRLVVLLLAGTAVLSVASIASVRTGMIAAFGTGLEAVAFAGMILLFIGKDLGFAFSKGICFTIVVIQLLILLYTFISIRIIGGAVNEFYTMEIIRSGSMLLYSIILTVMVYAKYFDKSLRGTK